MLNVRLMSGVSLRIALCGPDSHLRSEEERRWLVSLRHVRGRVRASVGVPVDCDEGRGWRRCQLYRLASGQRAGAVRPAFAWPRRQDRQRQNKTPFSSGPPQSSIFVPHFRGTAPAPTRPTLSLFIKQTGFIRDTPQAVP